MAQMKKITLLLLALLALPLARADTLLVAAASDLTYCIDELGAAFGKQVPGAQLKVSLGSSGNFFAQIKHGAPYDVFMSADMSYPARLAQEGVADGATLAPYALGRIALWSLDARFNLAQGMQVLKDPRITRIAIANPEFAPYGRAARAALQHNGLWDTLKDKLVFGENISQTAQFVQTGNAQVGIVSGATLSSPRIKGMGSRYMIAETDTPPIEQGAIVTQHGKTNALAPLFMRFLRSQAARDIFARSGFALPREKAAPAA